MKETSRTEPEVAPVIAEDGCRQRFPVVAEE